MNRRSLEELLTRVQRGNETVEGALAALRDLPFADLGFAKPDLHRELRTGVPEVIFGEGKTIEQIAAIAARLGDDGQNAIVTRLDAARAAALRECLPSLAYHAAARLGVLTVAPVAPSGGGTIVVASEPGTQRGWAKASRCCSSE